jgi:excisionase family DNA binding protein
MKLSQTSDRHTTAGQEAVPGVHAALISIDEVAGILDCSTRHVRRLVDSGRIPRPVKLGALLRWVRTEIDQWIAAGCPNCRKSR